MCMFGGGGGGGGGGSSFIHPPDATCEPPDHAVTQDKVIKMW